MPECLNREELRQYASGAMATGAMLRADAHIAACASCRARLLDSPRLARVGAALIEKVRWNPRTEFNCLDDEQAAAYVEDALETADCEIVESHLEMCSRCVEDVRSLREFRAAMSTYSETVYAPRPPYSRAKEWPATWRALLLPQRARSWGTVTAGLLVVALISFWLWTRAGKPQIADPEAPELREQLQQAQSELQETKQRLTSTQDQLQRQEKELAELRRQTEPPAGSASAPVVALKDGAGAVEMRLRLPSGISLPRDLAEAAAELLSKGRVTPAESVEQAIAQLSPEGEAVRSGDEAAPAPLAPVRAFALSDRPTFRWTPVKGAAGYVVSLFQGQPRRLLWEKKVQAANELGFPAEQPPLRPGATYAWTVEAQLANQSSHSNLVKFQTLAAARRAEVRRLSRRYAGSHLILAALYEREGLYDEAEQALQSLLRQNPKNELARRLLATLQERRQEAQAIPK